MVFLLFQKNVLVSLKFLLSNGSECQSLLPMWPLHSAAAAFVRPCEVPLWVWIEVPLVQDPWGNQSPHCFFLPLYCPAGLPCTRTLDLSLCLLHCVVTLFSSWASPPWVKFEKLSLGWEISKFGAYGRYFSFIFFACHFLLWYLWISSQNTDKDSSSWAMFLKASLQSRKTLPQHLL